VVSPATVTVLVSGTQVYGGTPIFTYRPTLPGDLTFASPKVTCASLAAAALDPSLAVGTYTVDGSTCTGLAVSDPADATLAYTGAPTGFSVTPAPVTATVSGSMTYGEPVTATFSPITGPPFAGTPSCTEAAGGAALATLAAGTHAVTPASCSGLVSTTGDLAPAYTGDLVVLPAPTTVTVSGTMPYGEPGSAAFFHTTPAGVSVAGRLSCGRADGGTAVGQLAVGTHTVTPSSCTGLSAATGNWTVGYAAAPGGLTVVRATVTATVTGRQPDRGSPTFAYTTDAPAGVAVTGSLWCTALAGGPLSGSLAPGRYTLSAASCRGLAVGDPADFLLAYAAAPGGFAVTAASAGSTVASTPTGKGYWTVTPSGAVHAFGAAGQLGSEAGQPLVAPIVGIAPTPTGDGYWLVGSDGGIFAFGNAGFYGSMGGRPLARPIVGISPTPAGSGYWEVASDGGIFAFGDAGFSGSMGGRPLVAPIVGIAPTPAGGGYWLVGADGGIFAFGDAGFSGSMGGRPLVAPIVGIAPTPTGDGYWLVGADGGIFAFGDAAYE
ncbi:MAG: hypothetical protein ACRDWN_10185, partial [Acidimicrobiales bacterium]